MSLIAFIPTALAGQLLFQPYVLGFRATPPCTSGHLLLDFKYIVENHGGLSVVWQFPMILAELSTEVSQLQLFVVVFDVGYSAGNRKGRVLFRSMPSGVRERW